ncbi:hypothetical protein WK25_23375 [Burkholderia latens]|nr:hypothetical protein WK25_23375 [Burkholderia latens]
MRKPAQAGCALRAAARRDTNRHRIARRFSFLDAGVRCRAAARPRTMVNTDGSTLPAPQSNTRFKRMLQTHIDRAASPILFRRYTAYASLSSARQRYCINGRSNFTT